MELIACDSVTFLGMDTRQQAIYGRLQLSSRTAAVTRAFPDLAR
ncbi:MAG: hypothetical protein ACLQFR_02030 [Streptosporangiaceae bacterium]